MNIQEKLKFLQDEIKHLQRRKDSELYRSVLSPLDLKYLDSCHGCMKYLNNSKFEMFFLNDHRSCEIRVLNSEKEIIEKEIFDCSKEEDKSNLMLKWGAFVLEYFPEHIENDLKRFLKFFKKG